MKFTLKLFKFFPEEISFKLVLNGSDSLDQLERLIACLSFEAKSQEREAKISQSSLKNPYRNLQTRKLDDLDDIALSKTISIAVKAIAITLIIISLPLTILGLSLNLIWLLIAQCQSFYYLLFVNVEYPSNVQYFLYKAFGFSRLDFLEGIRDLVFPYTNDDRLSCPAYMKRYGADGLMIITSGNILLFVFLILIFYLLIKLLSNFSKKIHQRLNGVIAMLKQSFEWSGLLRLWITCYLELSFGAILQVSSLNFGSGIRAFSSVLALLVLTLNLLLLGFIFIKLKNRHTNPHFKSKFGTLSYEFLEQPYHLQYFMLLVLFKRICFVTILDLIKDSPYDQLMSLAAVNFIVAAIILLANPYSSKSDRIIKVFEEIVQIVIYSLLYGLAPDDEEESPSRPSDSIGWSITLCCLLSVAINLGCIVHQQIVCIYKHIQNIRKSASAKPKESEEIELEVQGSQAEQTRIDTKENISFLEGRERNQPIPISRKIKEKRLYIDDFTLHKKTRRIRED